KGIITWNPGSFPASMVFNIDLVQYQSVTCIKAPCPMMPSIAPYPLARNFTGDKSTDKQIFTWIVGNVQEANRIVNDGAYYIQVCQSGTNVCDSSDSYFKIVTSTTQPPITVTSPNGGEQWQVGKSYEIKYFVKNPPTGSKLIKLWLQETASLANLKYLATIVPLDYSSDYTWLWQIPANTALSQYKILVELYQGTPGYEILISRDESDAPFSIVSATTQPLIVSSSEIIGSQTTYASSQTIKFSVKGMVSNGATGLPSMGFNVQAWMQTIDPINTVQINGVYQSFNANYNPNTALWDITMTTPSDASKTYKIDTAFYCSNSSLGCSSGQINKSFNFNLSSQTQPSITVLSPNGSEQWQVGSMQTVQWTSTDLSSSDSIGVIRLRNFSGTEFNLTQNTTSNDGQETIIVPQSLQAGTYTLEVKSLTSVIGKSAPFSVVTPISTTTAVPCSYAGRVGVSQFVGCVWKWAGDMDPKTADDGISAGDAPVANTLNFSWPYPNDPPINQYAGNDNYSARWKGNFTFKSGTYRFTGGADDGIRVRVNGITKIDQWARGEYREASFDMTFNTQQVVNIEVDYYEHIWSGAVKFGWAPVTVSPPAPTITALSPNGGEIFTQGSRTTIRWETTNFESLNVNIQLFSFDDVADPWSRIASIIPNIGNYAWDIPQLLSGRFKIIVSASVVPGEIATRAMDESDAPFSIVALTTTTTTSTASLTVTLDINGDGAIDRYDANVLANVIFGSNTCPSGKSCDINSDGKVNALDILKFSFINIGRDLNSDGVVNMSDAELLANVIMKTIPCPTGKNCDINGSGSVSIFDLVSTATTASSNTVLSASVYQVLLNQLLEIQRLLNLLR
ncbi:MAG: dockerin type I domain-containing protein, partial [Patescibacteria group bacterium]